MKSEDTDTSRRLVVGGLATGLVAGAAVAGSTPAAAVGAETATAAHCRILKQNTRSRRFSVNNRNGPASPVR